MLTVPTVPTPIGAGVPAYFSPGPLWDVMLGTANTGDAHVSVVVVNPANGPGPARDESYARVIALARTRGVRVLGYVATGYSTRTSVLADIERYREFYGLVDIFLDEATSDCATLAIYTPWIAAVRANGGVAAVNPGIVPASCWNGAADIIVTFEGPFASYLHYETPPWMTVGSESTYWNIVYAVPPGSEAFVRDVAGRHATGLLYVTEDVLPNPYDSLPPALSVVTVPPSTMPLATAPPITVPPIVVGAPVVQSTLPTPVTAPTTVPTPATTPAPPTVPSPTTTPPLIIVLTPPTTGLE